MVLQFWKPLKCKAYFALSSKSGLKNKLQPRSTWDYVSPRSRSAEVYLLDRVKSV